jgi:hypothetical protein
MKKLFALVSMFIMVLAASAQDDKIAVCIDQFKNNSQKSDITVKNLRNEIMQGIIAKNRLTVVDITTLGNLPSVKNERLKALGEKGIEYVIEGSLNSIDTKKHSDGKSYIAEINYTLTVIDTSTGETKSSDTFKDSWYSGSTTEESTLKAIEHAKNRMNKFVDDNFKVAATIKALDQVDEKKGVKTCYVTIGSAAGIAKGQIFEVFASVEVAGEKVDKKIGEVRAKEVMSATLTLCDVKSGGLEIKKNFENKVQMKVVSRAKAGLFGGNSILNL